MKQRIQSPGIPPCHRHMVITTTLSLCIALPCCHRSADQTGAERCLEFTARGGYRMFPGLSRSALTLPLAPVSHKPCTLGLVSTLVPSLSALYTAGGLSASRGGGGGAREDPFDFAVARRGVGEERAYCTHGAHFPHESPEPTSKPPTIQRAIIASAASQHNGYSKRSLVDAFLGFWLIYPPTRSHFPQGKNEIH